MTVTSAGTHIAGGLVCIHISGATGTTAEVVVDGKSSSLRFVVDLASGKGDLCFRLPPGFGEDVDIDVMDDVGERAMTGSFQI